jgi:uncharacterized membrane protein
MADGRPALALGRCFFGLATAASGVLQLAIGGFVRLVPPLPAWVPAKAALPYVVGVVLVALGLAIASGRMARTAATLLAGLIMAMLVLVTPQAMVSNPDIDRPLLRGFMYTNPLKCLALIGGAALIAAVWPDGELGLFPGGGVGKWARVAPILLAAFLFVCGFQHYWYREFVDALVPAWIPPSQRFWTFFTGTALMAGGIGILVPRTARLAASLSALMIFLWVLLLHIPRAIGTPNHAFETAGVFEALALSGVALLVAGRYSGESDRQVAR